MMSDESVKLMDGADEERLYGLIEIAERQQSVVQTAIEGVVKERIAFGQELQQFGERLASLEDDVHAMVEKVVQEVVSGAEGAGEAAANGAVGALKAILDDVVEQAEQTQATLRQVTTWLSLRVLGFGLGGVVALAVLSWMASSAVVLWDTSAIGRDQVQKAQLQTELAQLRANREAWADAGMEAKLTRCGPRERACVRVDETAGAFGDHGDYRIINSR